MRKGQISNLRSVRFSLLISIDPPGDDWRRLGPERLAFEFVLVVDRHGVPVPDQLRVDRTHLKQEKIYYYYKKSSCWFEMYSFT